VLFEQQPELHQLYVSFDALLQPVARTAARARAENFRTLFIVFPFKDFQIK